MSVMRHWKQPATVLTAAITLMVCGAANASAEEAKSVSVEVLDSATLEVPAEWERVDPRSRIVQYEFAVGEEKEDDKKARLTMMAAGGNVEANIERWKGQLTGGDADAQKTQELEVAGHTVHLVDLSGTYTERMGGGPFAPGPTVKRPDYAMTAAIIVDESQRKFFVKLIGPESVVKTNREKFVEMIKGMEKR